MPQHDEIDIRALHIDYPDGVERRRITVKHRSRKQHDIIDVTSYGELSNKALRSIVREHYKDFNTEVKIPKWPTQKITG